MKKYFLFAATALALAACSNEDDNLTNGPVEARISAGVSTPATRAINDQWEQDAIGVMVTKAPGSDMEELYKNVKYTTTANNVTSADFIAEGQGIFFQDADETATFAAYGPYQTSAANALPGTDGVITGSTAKQSARPEQKAFDYIYASEATASRSNPIVQFQGNNAFEHRMTRLIIIVKTSAQDGFTTEQVTEGRYSLSGLKHEGTFNVTDGTAKANDDAEVTNDWSLNDNSLITSGETELTFTSILYPQTLGSELTFKAVIDGQTYTNNQISPTLEAGKSSTITITVKKTGLEMNGCTVSDWNDGSTYTGDAKMK